MTLRSELLRLASEHPELRAHLVPLLRKEAATSGEALPYRSQIVPFPATTAGLNMKDPEAFIKGLGKLLHAKGTYYTYDVGDKKGTVMHRYTLGLPRLPQAKDGKPTEMWSSVFFSEEDSWRNGYSWPLKVPVLQYVFEDLRSKYNRH